MFHVSNSLVSYYFIQTKPERCADIADYMYTNQADLALNLTGFWISDRSCPSLLLASASYVIYIAVISWDVVQMQIPAMNFVDKYRNVFAFK